MPELILNSLYDLLKINGSTDTSRKIVRKIKEMKEKKNKKVLVLLLVILFSMTSQPFMNETDGGEDQGEITMLG